MGRPSNTEERRTEIARALLSVMAKRGYDGATVADVARAADIAPGLVHYHYKNKLEILLAAIVELVSDYDTRLGAALEAVAGGPREELRVFVDAHLRVGAAADPVALACWIVISGEALREPRVKKAFGKALSASHARLRGIVVGGTESGAFFCEDPDVVAGAVLAVIQGYFVLAATARDLIVAGSAASATLTMALSLLAKPSKRRGAP